MSDTPATPVPAPEPAATPVGTTPVAPVPVTPQRRRFSGLGLTALIFAVLAWLVTAGGILLFTSAFSGSSEGSHLVPPIFAFLASAGIALLVSVPIGVLAAILALISFFLRHRGKALGIIAFILSLPFAVIAGFYALVMAGVFGS